tara:strand:+ start:84 stop:1115 length:1032 start_codon:yes stop_codon:yes gene_type:complete
MAYVDLLQQDITIAQDTATVYNFSDTLPPSQDGSPHMTHLGIQLDGAFAAAATLNSNMSGLIQQLKIQVGSQIIIDWFSPADIGSLDGVSQLGVLGQTLGGQDFCLITGDNSSTFDFLAEFSLPVGLDASKAHRINVTLGFYDVSTWSGATGGFASGGPILNLVTTYGTSTEATIIGGRQDNTIATNSQRTVTILGKQGFNMLGVLACGPVLTADTFTEYKVNNGQFRQLKVSQWRSIAGRYNRSPLVFLPAGSSASAPSGDVVEMQYQPFQTGVAFLNLFRISAGADLQIQITNGGDSAISSIFPIYVAPIGTSGSGRPAQTAKQVDSPTKTVLNESQSSNV